MGKRGPSKRPGSTRDRGELSPIGDIPSPPETLGGRGLVEWHRVGGILSSRGIVSGEDWSVLLALCQAVELNDAAAREYQAKGAFIDSKQGLYRHPAVTLMMDSAKQVLSCSARLGLSPTDRAGMSAPLAREGSGKAKFFS